jgi:2-dehydropantoate 2-reductase
VKLFNREKASPAVFSGRIGIIGSGALGAFYGARLARSGHDVHFLMRRDYEAVLTGGLKIKSFEGDFEIRPQVYSSAAQMGRCDLLIIGLKSTDNAALAGLLKETAGPRTIILTLQNGLGNEEAICEALGGASQAERIIGGTAFLCSNRIGPGLIHHSDHGWIRIAEFRGGAQPRTQTIAELFRTSGIRCEVADSLLKVRWEKLVWNIPFNGLGVAAFKADTEVVLGNETLSAVARGLMEETIIAAASDHVRIARDMVDRMLKNTQSMGAYRSSMQIDFEKGRPMEVEAIVGEPLRRAQRAGLTVPRLEFLYGILSRLNDRKT